MVKWLYQGSWQLLGEMMLSYPLKSLQMKSLSKNNPWLVKRKVGYIFPLLSILNISVYRKIFMKFPKNPLSLAMNLQLWTPMASILAIFQNEGLWLWAVTYQSLKSRLWNCAVCNLQVPLPSAPQLDTSHRQYNPYNFALNVIIPFTDHIYEFTWMIRGGHWAMEFRVSARQPPLK